MNKYKKIIITSLLSIVIIYFAYCLIVIFTNQYNPILGHENKYYYLFKDSIINDLNSIYSFGNKNDTFYVYNYKKDVQFVIWRLQEFDNINLNEIKLNNVILSENIVNKAHFSFNFNPNTTIDSKLKLPIADKINLILDMNSNEIRDINRDNCRIFITKLISFGITNYKGEYQIISSFDGNIPILANLIFYKRNGSFFFILVNGYRNHEINEDVLKFLRLN
jgi:hypothetical protein